MTSAMKNAMAPLGKNFFSSGDSILGVLCLRDKYIRDWMGKGWPARRSEPDINQDNNWGMSTGESHFYQLPDEEYFH